MPTQVKLNTPPKQHFVTTHSRTERFKLSYVSQSHTNDRIPAAEVIADNRRMRLRNHHRIPCKPIQSCSREVVSAADAGETARGQGLRGHGRLGCGGAPGHGTNQSNLHRSVYRVNNFSECCAASPLHGWGGGSFRAFHPAQPQRSDHTFSV